ncbi:hypothetical protein ACJ73_03584 [Blastomyces percursus]|uniref:EVE domain-containing protein n=1 Tax=Blastomyces percursus TaxID=1658174 RepID=A0A1J9Q9B3_9EURO|nr:hypothetical protein ACJ73_03584 [Blastomyces percursus]
MPPKRCQSTTVAPAAASIELSQNDSKKRRLSNRSLAPPVVQTAASSRPKRASRALHVGKESPESEPSEGVRKRTSGANTGKTKREEDSKASSAPATKPKNNKGVQPAAIKSIQHGSGPPVSADGIETEPSNKRTVNDPQDEEDDSKSYWLMKAEPESRIEKGVDVRFSIDDLRDATEPEPWDGKLLVIPSHAPPETNIFWVCR